MAMRLVLVAGLLCTLALSIGQDPSNAGSFTNTDLLFSEWVEGVKNTSYSREHCESFLSESGKGKWKSGVDGCDRKKTLHHKRACRYKDQVNRYFETFYLYEAFHTVLSRPSVAFHGFAKHMRREADRHLKTARQLIDYKNSRGDQDTVHGIVNLDRSHCVSRYFRRPTPSPSNFICFALNKELEIRQQLEEMHLRLEEDPNAQDHLEHFIRTQTEVAATLETIYSNLRPSLSLEDCLMSGEATSSAVLEHLIDRQLLNDKLQL